jgi:diguanylate cyclase (GGDEF)-like protein
MKEIDINSIENIDALTSFPLFAELKKDEFNVVKYFLKPILINKDESIINEGEEGEDMFIFLFGELTAYIMQSDGNQRKIFDVKLGDFFGEMSIIAHEPRSATITATVDSIVMKLHKTDFYKIITEYPDAGFKMLKTISGIQNQWLDQSSKSYSDLIRWGEAARKRAITDEMTGLYNRYFLEESIKKRFNNKSMNLRVMTMLMMDLDKIHGINDRHGTKGGDLTIIAAANIIAACVRPEDIPSRLSGDEFAILMPDTDLESAFSVAERIREQIENKKIEVPVSPGSEETTNISTRTSIGVATAPLHANTLEGLMETSDEALRKAKELGRNRVEIYKANN